VGRAPHPPTFLLSANPAARFLPSVFSMVRPRRAISNTPRPSVLAPTRQQSRTLLLSWPQQPQGPRVLRFEYPGSEHLSFAGPNPAFLLSSFCRRPVFTTTFLAPLPPISSPQVVSARLRGILCFAFLRTCGSFTSCGPVISTPGLHRCQPPPTPSRAWPPPFPYFFAFPLPCRASSAGPSRFSSFLVCSFIRLSFFRPPPPLVFSSERWGSLSFWPLPCRPVTSSDLAFLPAHLFLDPFCSTSPTFPFLIFPHTPGSFPLTFLPWKTPNPKSPGRL